MPALSTVVDGKRAGKQTEPWSALGRLGGVHGMISQQSALASPPSCNGKAVLALAAALLCSGCGGGPTNGGGDQPVAPGESSATTNAKPAEQLKPIEAIDPVEAAKRDDGGDTSQKAKPPDAGPDDRGKPLGKGPQPPESSERQPTDAPPADSSQRQPMDAPPAEASERQPTDAPPAEASERQPKDAPPAEASERQPKDAPPGKPEGANADAETLPPKPSRPVYDEPIEPEKPVVRMSDAHAKTCLVNIGDAFPEMSLLDVQGQPRTLSEFYGPKLTLVVFWSARQRLAREQFARLEREVVQQHGGRGVKVVAINVGGRQEETQKLTKKSGATFECWLDGGGDAFALVAARKLPRSYLLDPDGVVLWLDIEYSQGTRRELRNAIEYFSGGAD
jgi:peroxiredoxin